MFMKSSSESVSPDIASISDSMLSLSSESRERQFLSLVSVPDGTPSSRLQYVDQETAGSTSAYRSNKKGRPKSKAPALKSRIAIGTKRRENRSEVWDYFEKLEQGTYLQPEGDDYKRGMCQGCKTLMICDSRYSTTNLKRHMKSCLKLQGQDDVKQMLLDASISDDVSLRSSDVSLRSSEIDNSLYRELLVKMIVRHELPFLLVESEGVRDVHAYLNPDVEHITTRTCQAGMFKLYQKGKSKVMDMLSLCPGRISLTSDFWYSMTGDSYMCINANFIDKNWRLQNFVLCFSSLSPPNEAPLISEKVSKLLGEDGWNIEHRLMTITLDNVTSDDTFVDLYMTKLLSQGGLLLNGRFFRVRCVAHVINLIVKECLEQLHGVVQKVRDSVKYVQGSPCRLMKFKDAARDKKIPCVKALKHDMVTRWNSTYLMLESALFYKGAFSHLAVIDEHYPYCPSPDEWKKVEVFCKFLKLYYDLTNLFSGDKYPTSDLFFHRVWPIQYQLLEEAKKCDCVINALVMKMLRRFDNYWEECSLILSAAVVLDPRYKMRVVEYVYTKIYGRVEGFLKAQSVRDFLLVLFNEYKEKNSSGLFPSGPSQMQQVSKIQMGTSDIYSDDFDTYGMDENTVEKSELDMYLQDPLLDRKQDLDVLNWWKSVGNEYCFPCLGKLARDLLSIPMTSIAPNSAFSVGGRILTTSRCSLSRECLEALICTQDWIFGLKEKDQGHMDAAAEAMLSLDINASTSQGASRRALDVH